MVEREREPRATPRNAATYECVAATKTTHTQHTHFICQLGYSHIRPIVQHQLQQQAAGHLLLEQTKRSSRGRGKGITWLQLAALAACCVTMLIKNICILSLPSCAPAASWLLHTQWKTLFFFAPIASCMHSLPLFLRLPLSLSFTPNLGKTEKCKILNSCIQNRARNCNELYFTFAEGVAISTRGGKGVFNSKKKKNKRKISQSNSGVTLIVIPCYMAAGDLWFLADCAFPLIILVDFDFDSLRS